MSVWDTVDLRSLVDFASGLDEGGYFCEPIRYVEPEVGGTYRMHYAFNRRGNVTVLGVFDELIVVRYEHGKQDVGGYMSFEEAVVRRNARFSSLTWTEAAPATDANAPVEE